MDAFVEDDITRAGTFFGLAFVTTVVAGAVIGDVRLGIETGILVGLAFAVFAYFFIKPTAGDDIEE